MNNAQHEAAIRPSSCPAVTKLIREWAAVRPDLDTWAYRILASAVELERQLSLALTPAFDELGIKGGDYEVLSHLRRAGAPYEQSPTQLSKALHLTTGAVTRRLDRLVESEHVIRLRHGSDRRAVVIRLTPTGLAAVDQAVDTIVPSLTALLEPVRDRTEDYEQIVALALANLAASETFSPPRC